MILRTPSFYSRFLCSANKCTDTCCIGWEIDVDPKTRAKYKKWGIDSILEDDHIKLAANNGCPLLQGNGLCGVICQFGCNGTDLDKNGESVLGDICREHPRFVEVYGDIMEKGVGLCCEESVKLVLDNKNNWLTQGHFNFIEQEIDDTPDEMPEGAEEARNAILAEREYIFEILADDSVALRNRLIELLDFTDSVSGADNSEKPKTLPLGEIWNAWIDILGEGESYGPAWDSACEKIRAAKPSERKNIFTDNDGARIIAYMIFRYYAKSLFDGDNLSKVKFAIFFWIILKNFGLQIAGDSIADPAKNASTPQIDAIKLFSKQTEYSDEIMDLLYDNFCNNPAFSVESFRKVLEQA